MLRRYKTCPNTKNGSLCSVRHAIQNHASPNGIESPPSSDYVITRQSHRTTAANTSPVTSTLSVIPTSAPVPVKRTDRGTHSVLCRVVRRRAVRWSVRRHHHHRRPVRTVQRRPAVSVRPAERPAQRCGRPRPPPPSLRVGRDRRQRGETIKADAGRRVTTRVRGVGSETHRPTCNCRIQCVTISARRRTRLAHCYSKLKSHSHGNADIANTQIAKLIFPAISSSCGCLSVGLLTSDKPRSCSCPTWL